MRGFYMACRHAFNSDGRLRALVAAVLIGNLFFIALHMAHLAAGTSFDPSQTLLNAGLDAPKFALDADQGYAE